MEALKGVRILDLSMTRVTDRGVHVCPILIESPDSLLGESLEEAASPFRLNHGACLTCYQYGAICSNASSGSVRRE
jgi:hypothetical protein